MLCLASAGAIAAFAASSFTLSWTHSVERTLWRESWVVADDRLALVEASVEGSGAGIALPPDAVWSEGRWHYVPDLPPVPELVLAASGMTASPWRFCLPDGSCQDLGRTAGAPDRIWAAADCSSYR